MNKKEYFEARDKNGNLKRCWIENCSGNQIDWDETLELYILCFQNDLEFIDLCPEDELRTVFLRKFFKWDFVCSGLCAGGGGGLVCVKAVPKKSPTDDGYQIISAVNLSIDYNEHAADRPVFTPQQSINIDRKLKWEDDMVFAPLYRIAEEMGTTLWYWPYRAVHPDFQSQGIGTKVFKRGEDLLYRDFLKLARIKKGNTFQQHPLSFGLSTNLRTFHFSQKMMKEVLVGHLHCTPKDRTIRCYEKGAVGSADCYWIILLNPIYDANIVIRLRQHFSYLGAKL